MEGQRESRTADIKVLKSHGELVAETAANMEDDGFFEARWTVPRILPLGTYTVVASLGGAEGRARLVIT